MTITPGTYTVTITTRGKALQGAVRKIKTFDASYDPSTRTWEVEVTERDAIPFGWFVDGYPVEIVTESTESADYDYDTQARF